MIDQINQFADYSIRNEVNNPEPEGKQITELKNLNDNVKKPSCRIPQKIDSYKRAKSENKPKDLLSLSKLLKRYYKEKINNKEPLNVNHYLGMLRKDIASLDVKIYFLGVKTNSLSDAYLALKKIAYYSVERNNYKDDLNIIKYYLGNNEKEDSLESENMNINIEKIEVKDNNKKDFCIIDEQKDKADLDKTKIDSTKETNCNYIKEKKILSPIFQTMEYNNFKRRSPFKTIKTLLGRKKKKEEIKENNAKKDDTDPDNGKIKILRKCGENISTVLWTYISLIDSKKKIFKKYLLNKNLLDNEKRFLSLKVIDFIGEASQRNTNENNQKDNFEKIRNIIDSNNKEKALELSILNHFCQMRIVKLVEMYIEDNKKIEVQFKGEKKVIELQGFETLKDLKRKVVKDFKDNRKYPEDIKKKFKNKIEELLKGYKNESNFYFSDI